MATTAISNWTKRVFGEAIDVLGQENTLAGDIKFSQENKTGDTYTVPLKMSDEQGFSYNSDHSGFTLLGNKDLNVQRAELEGSEIVGQAAISYGNMAKLSANNGESKKAYKQAVGSKIESAMASGERRRELAIMYGPGSSAVANLGVVNAVVSAVTTVLTVNLTRATWAGGLWRNLIGAGFDFHTTGGTSHTLNAEMILTGVNKANCRLTFSGHATDVAAVLANGVGDVITFRGSRTVSAVGIQAILENSSSLFGINAANYPAWKAVVYAVGGPLTFDKVVEGLSEVSENGLDDGGSLYLGAKAWTDLMTDEAALRRHVGDKMADKVKTGASALEFETLAGVVKIVTHRGMKQGQAWFIPPSYARRIGASELTFKLPGSPNEWNWLENNAAAQSEIRCYSDQAVLIDRPDLCVQYTTIASTADAIPA